MPALAVALKDGDPRSLGDEIVVRINDQKCSDLFVELQVCHVLPSNPGRETDTLAQLMVHGIKSAWRKLVSSKFSAFSSPRTPFPEGFRFRAGSPSDRRGIKETEVVTNDC
jgi:hypothetical protein